MNNIQIGFNKKCFFHKGYISTININDNRKKEEQLLCCLNCITENNLKGDQLLILDDVLYSDDNTIIDKLPLVEDGVLIQKIKQSLQLTEKIARNEFITFFEGIEKEFKDQLSIIQKLALSNIDEIIFTSQELIEAYHKVSNKKELKDILLEITSIQNQDVEEQFLDKLNNFIKKMSKQKKENTQYLQEKIDRYMKSQDLLKLNTPNQIKKNILDQMEQMKLYLNDIFKIKNLEVQNISNKNQKQKVEEEKQINIKELIYSLISSKSNYCKSSFLQFYQDSIEIINMPNKKITHNDVFEKQKQPLNFNNFDVTQLQYTEEITLQLYQMNEEVNNFKNNQNYSNNQLSINNFKSNFIESLNKLKKYQINSFLSQYQEKCVDKTYSFKLKKSQSDPHFVSISRNLKGQLQISQMANNLKTDTQIEENLSFNKIYTINLEFSPFIDNIIEIQGI